MSQTLTEHTLFKPRPSKGETKASVTDNAARTIIGAETLSREAKTARLREARLRMEAETPVVVTPPKRRASSAKKARPSASAES